MTVTHFSQTAGGMKIEVREEWGEETVGFFIDGSRQQGFATVDEAVTYADAYASERYYEDVAS